VLGFAFAPWSGGGDVEPVDLAGKRAIETGLAAKPVHPRTTVDVRPGSLDGSIEPPERQEQEDREYDREYGGAEDTGTPVTPTSAIQATTRLSESSGADGGRGEAILPPSETVAFDESAPIVYRETSVETNSTAYEEYTLVRETTTVTEVNSLEQTRTTTSTTSYTQPNGDEATALKATEPPPTT
jgi:hypothetical protein